MSRVSDLEKDILLSSPLLTHIATRRREDGAMNFEEEKVWERPVGTRCTFLRTESFSIKRNWFFCVRNLLRNEQESEKAKQGRILQDDELLSEKCSCGKWHSLFPLKITFSSKKKSKKIPIVKYHPNCARKLSPCMQRKVNKMRRGVVGFLPFLSSWPVAWFLKPPPPENNNSSFFPHTPTN